MWLKVLLAIAAVVVLVVAVLAVVVAMQPSEFRIQRSATINAPAPAVFAQVNDFHSWQAWSPWAKLDPSVKNSFEGAPAGPGAAFAWAGNSKIGEGRMTIVESRPSELVKIKLEFLKPFAATNTAEFTFKPEGERTAVTWSHVRTQQFPRAGRLALRGHGQGPRGRVRQGPGRHEVGGGSVG